MAFLMAPPKGPRADVNFPEHAGAHVQQGLDHNPRHFQDYKFLEQPAEADHEVYSEQKSATAIHRPLFLFRRWSFDWNFLAIHYPLS